MNNGLESLKEIKQIEVVGLDMGKFTSVKIDTCPNYWRLFDTIERELKALEIIKPFIKLETDYDNGYQLFYLKIGKEYIEITMKQYDLLKEILNDK